MPVDTFVASVRQERAARQKGTWPVVTLEIASQLRAGAVCRKGYRGMNNLCVLRVAAEVPRQIALEIQAFTPGALA